MSAGTEWLAQLRSKALAALQVLPEPEGYDALDLAEMDLSAVAMNQPTRNAVCSDVPSGVICADLLSATNEYPEIVHKFLASVVDPSESRFTALHYALLGAGCFLYVPPNTTVELSLHIDRGNDILNSSYHTLIVADHGARVTVLQAEKASRPSLRRVVDITEVVARAGADVELAGWQDLGAEASHYSMRRGLLERDASIDWITCSLGAGTNREIIESWLRGTGSHSGSVMLFLGSGSQRHDLMVKMLHEGEHTSSEILARGVLGQHARTDYRGRAAILSDARHASSFQRQNTLLLSKDARIDTIPELLIDVDEVDAGHATTVGQIDRDQLFYLMSRGLDRGTAIRMIIDGFIEPIVQQIPFADEQETLRKLIDRKVAI